jgi:hypothetical protein
MRKAECDTVARAGMVAHLVARAGMVARPGMHGTAHLFHSSSRYPPPSEYKPGSHSWHAPRTAL